MKYYLIVGEASGDLHASNLMKALIAEDASAEFRFFGGDKMMAVGGTCVKHYKELAYMGFVPVLMHLRTIFRNMAFCERYIMAWNPDVVLLVDYPGFNLQVAAYLKKHSDVPVYYYISPKIWAWKEYRIKNIKRDVTALFSILPFEVDFYNQQNYPVHYVGNPCVDAVADYSESHADSFESFIADNGLEQKPVIAILAGSRKQEIKDNLVMMVEAASAFTDQYQLVLAAAPGIERSFYRKFLDTESPVHIVENQTYRLLQFAEAALVTSGTATLETCLFRVPQVVCYYTPIGRVIAFLKRHVLKVKYISLVNLIAGKEVVKELVADKMKVGFIRKELEAILYNKVYRQQMLDGYEQIIQMLGKPGASVQAARKIVSLLSSAKQRKG